MHFGDIFTNTMQLALITNWDYYVVLCCIVVSVTNVDGRVNSDKCKRCQFTDILNHVMSAILSLSIDGKSVACTVRRMWCISYRCNLIMNPQRTRNHPRAQITTMPSLGSVKQYSQSCVANYSTLMVILPMPCWGCRVKPHGMAVPSDAFTHIISFLFKFSIW